MTRAVQARSSHRDRASAPAAGIGGRATSPQRAMKLDDVPFHTPFAFVQIDT